MSPAVAPSPQNNSAIEGTENDAKNKEKMAGSSLLSIQLSLLEKALAEKNKALLARVIVHAKTLTKELEGSKEAACEFALLFPAQEREHIKGIFGLDQCGRLSRDGDEKPSSLMLPPLCQFYIYYIFACILKPSGGSSSSSAEVKQHSILQNLINEIPKDAFYDALFAKVLQKFAIMSLDTCILMPLLRKCQLAHMKKSFSVCHTSILRKLILDNDCEAAGKFIANAAFPGDAPAAQCARYNYYLAIVLATRSEYGKSFEALDQAICKAPHGKSSIGFIQTCQKLGVIIQLLLGEIPDRKLFHQQELSVSLAPYLRLCQAVRGGDINDFQQVVREENVRFVADRTLQFVQRLYHNVLKTGIKRLGKAYTKISLQDVKEKLSLPSIQDTEFVLIKAIKDGLLSGATIDHSQSLLQISSSTLKYHTKAPQLELDQRITALNKLHDECLTAMDYSHKKKEGPSSILQQSEAENIQELMEEIDDDEDDYEGDMMDF